MNYTLIDWTQNKEMPDAAKLLGIVCVRLSHAMGSRTLPVDELAVQMGAHPEEVRTATAYSLEPADFAELDGSAENVVLRDGLPWMSMLDRPGADWTALRAELKRREQRPEPKPAEKGTVPPFAADGKAEDRHDVRAAGAGPEEKTKSGKPKAQPKVAPATPPEQEPGVSPDEHKELGATTVDADQKGRMRLRDVAKAAGWPVAPAGILVAIRFTAWWDGNAKEGLTLAHKVPDAEALVEELKGMLTLEPDPNSWKAEMYREGGTPA